LLGCYCCSPEAVDVGEDVVTIEDVPREVWLVIVVAQVDVGVPDGK
jgi:hypothetical protein